MGDILNEESTRAVELQLSAIYEEYRALRAELLARIQTQNLMIQSTIVALGAAVAAVAASSAYPSLAEPIAVAVGLFLPLVTFPLGFVFLDNEIMIHAVGSRLHDGVVPRIRENTMSLQNDIFRNTWDYPSKPEGTPRVHHVVSVSRLAIFVIPIFLPLMVLIVLSSVIWSWWLSCCFAFGSYPAVPLFILGCGVLLLDLWLAYRFLCGMIWVLRRCVYLGRRKPWVSRFGF